MSADYYSRLEQERGPHPSEQMIASIAQGLHLSRDERDHLFRLAGHRPPVRGSGTDHIGPSMLRILDRLTDTPAEIVTELGRRCGRPRSGSHWSATCAGTPGRRAASVTAGSPIRRRGTAIPPRITNSIRACTFPGSGSASNTKLQLLSVVGAS